MIRLFFAIGVGVASFYRVLWMALEANRFEKRVARETAAARAAAIADQERAAAWRKANSWEVN